MFKLIMASVFCIAPLIAVAATATSEMFLTTNELDLLMGTPTGVAEPLDGRRTVLTEDNKIDYSTMLDDDFIIRDGLTEVDWQEASELSFTESEIETEYLNLISETSELEDISKESEFLANYFEKNNLIEEESTFLKEQIETDTEL